MAALRLVVSNSDPNDDVDAVRPPGALKELAFRDTCVGCGDCVEVCPSNSLRMDADRYPLLLDPLTCTACGLCPDICMPGAISFTTETLRGLQMIQALEGRPGTT